MSPPYASNNGRKSAVGREDSAGGVETTQTPISAEDIQHWPKVELHAHLNGCIRETTLMELAQERGVVLSPIHASLRQHAAKSNNATSLRRSLSDCFELFADIAKAVTDLPALRRITREALEDFAQHAVAYLELRTTPKCLYHAHSDTPQLADKRAYLETVLSEMDAWEQEEEARYQADLSSMAKPRLPMVCRLIVAVDRTRSFEEAQENLQLAAELANRSPQRAVGVDLGGNPTVGDFRNLQPLFEQARKDGLKVTIHCGEVPCAEQDNDNDTANALQKARQELKAILDFQPDRLGHALLLPGDLEAQLLSSKIPIETCPTSNVMTLELVAPHMQEAEGATGEPGKSHKKSLVYALRHEHPGLKEWIAADYPLAISTDDPGVFDTTATQEVALLQQAFGLKEQTLLDWIFRSLDFAFCDQQTKSAIQKRWQQGQNSTI